MNSIILIKNISQHNFSNKVDSNQNGKLIAQSSTSYGQGNEALPLPSTPPPSHIPYFPALTLTNEPTGKPKPNNQIQINTYVL